MVPALTLLHSKVVHPGTMKQRGINVMSLSSFRNRFICITTEYKTVLCDDPHLDNEALHQICILPRLDNEAFLNFCLLLLI